eukprot:jgi/Ulvmu1/1254/UM109_0052.1
MICPKPECQLQLNTKTYTDIHVLDLDHAFRLKAPWFVCPSCKHNAAPTCCTASYHDHQLRQLEGFLKNGGVVNVHFIHIGGNVYVTQQAFFHILRMAQESSFAAAARCWRDAHLDGVRIQFGRAKRESRTLAVKEHAMVECIRELYDKLCHPGSAHHDAVQELNNLCPKAQQGPAPGCRPT